MILDPAPSPMPMQYLIRNWSRTVTKSSPRASLTHLYLDMIFIKFYNQFISFLVLSVCDITQARKNTIGCSKKLVSRSMEYLHLCSSLSKCPKTVENVKVLSNWVCYYLFSRHQSFVNSKQDRPGLS